MRNQQEYCSIHPPQSLPALFAILDPILPGNVQGIIENLLGNLKAQTVFLLVDTVFISVPNDFH